MGDLGNTACTLAFIYDIPHERLRVRFVTQLLESRVQLCALASSKYTNVSYFC
jgi:hypothetical protein